MKRGHKTYTYIRYTRDVGLLEISRDYMRAAEKLEGSLERQLSWLIDQLSPLAVRITGETRSGGFETRFVVLAQLCWLGWSGDRPGTELLDIIEAYAQTKQLGFLRLDGVVRSIQEPYKHYVAVMTPLLPPWRDRVVMRMTNHRTTIVVEGDNKYLERIMDILMGISVKITPAPITTIECWGNDVEKCLEKSIVASDYRKYNTHPIYRIKCLAIYTPIPPPHSLSRKYAVNKLYTKMKRPAGVIDPETGEPSTTIVETNNVLVLTSHGKHLLEKTLHDIKEFLAPINNIVDH